MFEKGIFNGLFDLDGDGKLDNLERALDFAVFVDLVENDKKENNEDEWE